MKLEMLGDTAIRLHPDFSQFLKVLWRDDKPKHVPFYELFVNLPVMETILGKKLPDSASTIEFYYKAGYDYVPIWPGLPMKTGDLRDTRLGYPIKDRRTFQEYPWPDESAITFAEFENVAPILPEGMKIIGQTGGIFEMAQALCGYQDICLLLGDDRKLVSDIFERIGLLYETIYAGMACIKEVGAVVISDDLGFKTQTLISPDDLREFVFPWYKRLVKIIHKNKKPCIIHSCGQLSEIMDELIEEIGIDAKHSYEDVIIPVEEAKELYGKRIAILGGFDVNRLCRGSQEEIRNYVDFLIDEVGVSGGYALGSGNSIADYVPVANYLAMLDQGKKLKDKKFVFWSKVF